MLAGRAQDRSWCTHRDGNSECWITQTYLQVVDWHNAPAQQDKRAVRRASRQVRKQEAQHAAWLRAEAKKVQQAARAARQAQLEQERAQQQATLQQER